jgi:hypothetical protein
MSTAIHPDWERVQRGALAAAVAGWALFLAIGLILHFSGGISSPLQFFLSYLVAYNYWLGVALGCLVVLMLQYMTGGAWGLLLRRVLEAAAGTMGLLAALFVPLLFGLPWLYIWAQPDQVAHDEDLQHQSLYLNVPWFIVRSACYFLIWLLLAFFLNKWSQEQDSQPLSQPSPQRGRGDDEPSPALGRGQGEGGLSRRFQLLSPPGILLYGGTITFAAIDWVMSLEPHWYSTIYPVLFATGQVLTGLAFAIAALMVLAQRPPLSEVITRTHLRDLGSLLLAFVMFWAYMSFSQFLLVWVGNLPEEIPWYLRRIRGAWEIVALAIIALHFAVPFLLLLSRDIKERRRTLAAVAVGLLVMRFIDLFWWIEPAYSHEGQHLYWLLDIAAMVGIGGVWVWWFLARLQRRPLLPINEPYFAEAFPNG